MDGSIQRLSIAVHACKTGCPWLVGGSSQSDSQQQLGGTSASADQDRAGPCGGLLPLSNCEALHKKRVSRSHGPFRCKVVYLFTITPSRALQLLANKLRACRSVDSLENRGLVNEVEQSHQSNDPFYSRRLPHSSSQHGTTIYAFLPVVCKPVAISIPLQLPPGATLCRVAMLNIELSRCLQRLWVSAVVHTLKQASRQAQNPTFMDPCLRAEMMRNVNTVQYGELSKDQIAAARQRRSQDR